MYITHRRLLKWALYSVAIYVFLNILFLPDGINIKKFVITSFMLFSVIAVITLSIKNWKQLKGVPIYARYIFYLLIFWGCIVIIRGFSLSIQDWVTNFGNIYMAAAWIAPIALILGLKIENWGLIYRTIFFMFHLMFILFFISLFHNISYNDWAMLVRPVNFILLIGLYRFRITDRLKVFIIIIIYIFLNAYFTSRRIDLVFLFLTFSLILMDRFLLIQDRKILLKYILFGFLFVFTIIFTVGYEVISNFIASFIDFQESRIFLFTELSQELSTFEKIIGRGSLGTYYSEYFDHTKYYVVEVLKEEWYGDAAIRITTEVGYLQMILKGGFIMLALHIIIYVYSIYLGIFRSNNKFISRLGYFILVISILSLIEFRPAFTPTFIIFWMAIGTVLSKKYRQMDDSEINALINFR